MRDILQLSIIKTFIFNLYYFALKGDWHIFFRFPCFISRNVKLKKIKGYVHLNRIRPGIVKIGFGDVAIFDHRERAIWMNRGDVFFDGKARFGKGIRIANTGIIKFGEAFEITAKSEIICRKEIVFGAGCLLSWNILIMDSDFHYIFDFDRHVTNSDETILIGNHVWIGCRATILKGTVIQDNSVVAAGALISQAVDQENSIIGSNGKILKENILWEK